MNSLSKCCNDEKSSTFEKKYNCNKLCSHPMPGEALLRCSNGNFASNFIFTDTTLTQRINQPIASVTIDTTCLRSEKLLIDFAGILTVTSINAALVSTFSFTLFKICKGSRIRQSLATFNFNYFNLVLGFPDSRTLKFEYSPCDDHCEDCCTYILELTSVSTLFTTTATVSISGTLCALAVESPC